MFYCSIFVFLVMNTELFYCTFCAVWCCYVWVILLIYFCYVSVTFILRFFYTFNKTKLLHNFYSYSLILRYSYASTDNYLTKQLRIEATITCNKRKCIEKSPPGAPIKKMVISVQESGYMLGQLGANTASTPSVKSRSVLKAKL